MIDVYIILETGKTMFLRVHEQTRIIYLIRKISNENDIPLNQIELYHNSTKLNETNTLADYNITDMEKIRAKFIEQGLITLDVQHSHIKSLHFKIQIPISESVLNLKKMIEERTQIPIKNQSLIHITERPVKLDVDERSLNSYGIRDGSGIGIINILFNDNEFSLNVLTRTQHFNVEVENTHTIRELIQRIEATTRLSMDNSRLIINKNGVIIRRSPDELNAKVSDYGLQGGDIIKIVPIQITIPRQAELEPDLMPPQDGGKKSKRKKRTNKSKTNKSKTNKSKTNKSKTNKSKTRKVKNKKINKRRTY
jgi:uncharacterized ubiquitin-like protein YukD